LDLAVTEEQLADQRQVAGGGQALAFVLESGLELA
jgi:hypothetical protein